MKEKKSLRSTMRRRRRSLTTGERARASERLCRTIARHPCFIRAGRIGIYYPSDGEIDPTCLVDSGPNRQFFLPVLPPRSERRLWFSPYQSGDRLIADRYGIPEPASRIRLRAENLDLLLVPLVAFDGEGGRIGMGGGFYDASLSFLSARARIHPVRVFGIAYQFQQIDKIPREAWDIPLHGVFTDLTLVSPG
jgi:5-formyltetrahydrofolate cyclo-ligase